MADERITIAGLDPISVSGMDAVVPVMRGGDTFKMTLEQVRALFFAQADNVAPALKDLSNTVGPRGKYPDGTDPSGDLNLRREQGYWIVGAGAPNNPLGDWGVLRVETDGAGTDATQYVRRYLADSPGDSLIYKRGFNTGTGWTAWIRVRENEAELDARYIQLSKLGMEFIVGSTLGSGYSSVEYTLPAGYKSFQLKAQKLRPAVDGGYVALQFKKGGSWITAGSSYSWAQSFWSSSGPGSWYQGSGGAVSTAILLSSATGVAAYSLGDLIVDIDPGDTSWASTIMSRHLLHGSSGSVGIGQTASAGRAEAVRLLYSTGDLGNIQSQLYGLRDV